MYLYVCIVFILANSKKKLAFIRVVNFDNEIISNNGRKQLHISRYILLYKTMTF